MTKEDSSHDDSSSVRAPASYKFFDSNLHYQFYTESGAAPSVMPSATQVVPNPAPQAVPSAAPHVMPSLAPQIMPENSEVNKEAEPPSQTSASTFSNAFNFNESLLKIFWRIDVDRNNRVNKAELQNAIAQKWFHGDEQILAEVLLTFYDELVSAPVFCDAGLSVNQILSSPLFSEMATKESDFYQPYGGYKKTKTKTNSFKMMMFRR